MNVSQLEKLLEYEFGDESSQVEKLLEQAEEWPASGRTRLLQALGDAISNVAYRRKWAEEEEDEDEEHREIDSRETRDLLEILKLIQAAFPKSGGPRFNS